MKKLIFIFLILTCTLNLQAQESEVTTYYFIRHAEKVRADKTDRNPNLTEKGMSRAQNWSTVFGNIDFDINIIFPNPKNISVYSNPLEGAGYEMSIYPIMVFDPIKDSFSFAITQIKSYERDIE